jgi:hypothetical protein
MAINRHTAALWPLLTVLLMLLTPDNCYLSETCQCTTTQVVNIHRALLDSRELATAGTDSNSGHTLGRTSSCPCIVHFLLGPACMTPNKIASTQLLLLCIVAVVHAASFTT